MNVQCAKMSTSASMGQSAFSEDGKYYSEIGNDGRCKIWDTETNLLKQEFTPDLHLSAPLSCLNWIQLDGGTSTPRWKNRKRKSSRPDDDAEAQKTTQCIAFGSSTGKILIYSLTHAKIESVLEDPSPAVGEQDINCLDWNKRQGLISCSSDSTIREWSITENTVKSKFKMSRQDRGMQTSKTTVIKIVPEYQQKRSSNPRLLLTASCQLRLWSLDTKSLLRTMVGHASDVCHLEAVTFPQDGRFYILSGSKNDRILSFWSINLTAEELDKTLDSDNESKTPEVIRKSKKRRSRTKSGTEIDSSDNETVTSATCNLLMEDIARQVTCLAIVDDSQTTVKVAAVTRSGVAHYYEHTLNGASLKPIKPDSTIQVASEEKCGPVKPAPLLCGSLVNECLLIGYSLGTGLIFERIIPNVSQKTQVLIRTPKEKQSTKKENLKNDMESATKIRHGNSSDPAIVYLTAELDNRNQKSMKRPIAGKQVDVPMESRLANLSLAQSGAGTNQPPNIKNMAQLLVQALHSKDSKLLQTVFECTDPEVAYNSMNRLPIQYLTPLLEHLTDMLAGKTNQCRSACVWASALCRAKSSALLSLGGGGRGLVAALAARRPALPPLLALKARLSLAVNNRNQDGLNDIQAPLLEYADTSSEDELDDMEDPVINNIDGDDDSASWHENDDDDDVDDNSSNASDQDMSES